MIRREASLLSLISLQLGLAAMQFGLACSPSSEAPDRGTGGTGSNTGGTSSTGGFSTGGTTGFTGGTTGFTGGTTGFTGGTTGTTGGTTGTTGGTTGTTGGTTGTTGGTTGTTGGTTGTTGGTTATTGGVATGTGGSTSACPPYTGALATSGASLIFKDGFGTAKMGDWKGYAYSYIYGTATITPGSSTAGGCFQGAAMCAAGSVPADDKAGAGIGWNINQAQGASAVGTVVVSGSVKFVLAGAKAGMRVSLGPVTGDEFCYTLTATDAAAGAAGFTVPAAMFKTACYGTTGVAYAGSMIKSIQIAVPGSTAGAVQPFDFCIVDIEPVP